MNSTLMRDFLFNVLLVVLLILLSILLIFKTEDSKPAIEDRNRLVVTMEWDDTSDVDIDLWIRDPAGRTVGHSRRNGEGIVLQRDDTGFFNDKITDQDGNETYAVINREILNIRKLIPGRYFINTIVYSNKKNRTYDPSLPVTIGPVTVITDLIQADPFAKWEGETVVMQTNCQQLTVLAFDVSIDDVVTVVENPANIKLNIGCASTLNPESSAYGY